MLKNSDLTVYHYSNGSYERKNYKNIWWYSKKDAEINETYSKENDVNIRIWNKTNIEDFRIGDIVVKGNLDFDITSQFDLDEYMPFNIIQLTNNYYSFNKHIHILASLFEDEIELLKAMKLKQKNGTYINDYSIISKHKVQTQNLTDDEVSATIYGANITKMLRIKSPTRELENFLMSKVGNEEDNVSNYYIKMNNKTYKINSVSKTNIDIELVNDLINTIQ